MVSVLSVDALSFGDLMMRFFLDVCIQFLFIDHPSIILTIVAMTVSLFDITRRSQPTKQLTFGSLYLVLWQFIPYLILIPHSFSFDEWLHCLLCLFGWIVDNVAWTVIDPLYSKMRVDIEIMLQHFIAHIINSKQMPTVRLNLNLTRLHIRCLPLLKKFYVISYLLYPDCTFNYG